MLNLRETRQYLKESEFENLFTQELGWDYPHTPPLNIIIEGFAKPETERSRDVKRLLEKIPYLNGGIFQKHQLETLRGENIEIPDKAFEQLFKFFEQYQSPLKFFRVNLRETLCQNR